MNPKIGNRSDSQSITEIAHVIHASAKRPFLIGIDGQSGAGKSYLADRLHERLPHIVIIRNDDFYQPMEEAVGAILNPEQGYEQYFDWRRLEQQVLIPLSIGQSAQYRRYDWLKGEVTEAIETVDATSIVVVEGVYVTRPELRKYFDLRIWVETDAQQRWQRQVARGENSQEWIERWAAAERFYVENHRPHELAHVIVRGE
jgi:uridine kinase